MRTHPEVEDLYGSAKRLRVAREWIEAHRSERGGGQLSVLDFGCGTGDLTLHLASRGDAVRGVDVHEASIEAARRRAGETSARFGSESHAEIAASRYDVVVCSEVLEHLENPGNVLTSLREALRPSGRLIVTVPNGYGPFENLNRLDRLLGRIGLGAAIDRGAWLARAAHWKLRGRGLPPRPGERGTAGAATLNTESPHIQFFRLPDLMRLFDETGFSLEDRRPRVVLCGPFVDFWAPLFSFGGRLYELNAHLADRVPFTWSSDWMFLLRRA